MRTKLLISQTAGLWCMHKNTSKHTIRLCNLLRTASENNAVLNNRHDRKILHQFYPLQMEKTKVSRQQGSCLWLFTALFTHWQWQKLSLFRYSTRLLSVVRARSVCGHRRMRADYGLCGRQDEHGGWAKQLTGHWLAAKWSDYPPYPR